jgi:hypothetical protein
VNSDLCSMCCVSFVSHSAVICPLFSDKEEDEKGTRGSLDVTGGER